MRLADRAIVRTGVGIGRHSTTVLVRSVCVGGFGRRVVHAGVPGFERFGIEP